MHDERRWCIRYNVDDKDDLKVVTESGLIWTTKFAQRGIDAIRSEAVALGDCKDLPPAIRAYFLAKGIR